jgi:hypothetical protein
MTQRRNCVERNTQITVFASYLIVCALAAASVPMSGCRSKNSYESDSSKSVASSTSQHRPLTDRVFERTPVRFKRGKYLVEGILTCWECHSEHDEKLPGWPPVPGKEGGGTIFDENPLVVAPNISPDSETGAGAWTDDMFVRAITEGHRARWPPACGHALFELSEPIRRRCGLGGRLLAFNAGCTQSAPQDLIDS